MSSISLKKDKDNNNIQQQQQPFSDVSTKVFFGLFLTCVVLTIGFGVLWGLELHDVSVTNQTTTNSVHISKDKDIIILDAVDKPKGIVSENGKYQLVWVNTFPQIQNVHNGSLTSIFHILSPPPDPDITKPINRMIFQPNGNIVIYNINKSAAWASNTGWIDGTDRRPNAETLYITDGGTLIISAYSTGVKWLISPSSGTPIPTPSDTDYKLDLCDITHTGTCNEYFSPTSILRTMEPKSK